MSGIALCLARPGGTNPGRPPFQISPESKCKLFAGGGLCLPFVESAAPVKRHKMKCYEMLSNEGCLLLESGLQKSCWGGKDLLLIADSLSFHVKQFSAEPCRTLGRNKAVGRPADASLISLCLVADVCSFCLTFPSFDLRRCLKRGRCAMKV